ncbi:MAG: hypothetical protein MZW92_43720 [Comamonadaceae bacterium]|nr:hypothetical protein [Comamonadaceae bacterium]
MALTLVIGNKNYSSLVAAPVAGDEAWPASPSTRSASALDRPDDQGRASCATRPTGQGAVPDRRRADGVWPCGTRWPSASTSTSAIAGGSLWPADAPRARRARAASRRDALGLRRAAQHLSDGHPRPHCRSSGAGGAGAADGAPPTSPASCAHLERRRWRRQRRAVPVRRVLDRRRVLRAGGHALQHLRACRWPPPLGRLQRARAGAAADAGSGSPPRRPRPRTLRRLDAARPRRRCARDEDLRRSAAACATSCSAAPVSRPRLGGGGRHAASR